jgi:hypothetical protein
LGVLFVGEFMKTCHPRNVEVYEVREMSFQEQRTREDLESWTCEAAKSRTCEDLESWTCEASESRTCGDPESWTCDATKSRTCEDLDSWTCEASKSRTRKGPKPWTCWTIESGVYEVRNLLEVKFGSHDARRFPERGDSRTSNKQSQRHRLQKSGFGVWTSGRLVNVCDVKDIHVFVHIRNILWARGCFRNVKAPSSPYKRGREGTCKRIHKFWGLSGLWEILSSPASSLSLNVFTVLSHVFGDPFRIFGYRQHVTCKTISISSTVAYTSGNAFLLSVLLQGNISLFITVRTGCSCGIGGLHTRIQKHITIGHTS